MSVRSERHTVRHIEVGLQRDGRGEPLLYLHSASAEGAAWGPPFEQLAERYEVIVPVHPGFPGTGGLEHIHHVTDVALHYVDLLDALRLSRAHVVGSSLGGWIAAEIASLYPDRVGTLVLCGAAGLWVAEAPIAEVFGVLPGELAERLFYNQQHPLAKLLHAAGDSVFAEPAPDEVLIAFHQATEATARIAWNPYFHNPALEPRLDRISAPTLILWGAEDRLIPGAHGAHYRACIRDAELRLIAACGHLPAIEQPQAFAEAVLGFLSAHPLAVANGS
jgi:pimeloyl-ACP methyl ester carboxylesterase